MDLFAFIIVAGIIIAVIYFRIKDKSNSYYMDDSNNPGYFNMTSPNDTLQYQDHHHTTESTNTDNNWNSDTSTDSSSVDSSSGGDPGGDSGGSSD